MMLSNMLKLPKLKLSLNMHIQAEMVLAMLKVVSQKLRAIRMLLPTIQMLFKLLLPKDQSQLPSMLLD